MSYWAVPQYSPVIEQEVFGTWFIDVNCGVQKFTMEYRRKKKEKKKKEEEEWGAHLEKSSWLKPSFWSWEGSKSRAECELSCTLESTKYFPLSARPRAPQLGPGPPESHMCRPLPNPGPHQIPLCRSSVCSLPKQDIFVFDIKAASGGTSITASRNISEGRTGEGVRGWRGGWGWENNMCLFLKWNPPAAPPSLPSNQNWREVHENELKCVQRS